MSFDAVSVVTGIRHVPRSPLRIEPRHHARFKAGQDILREFGHEARIVVVRDGWAVAWKSLSDGERQILDVRIAGDCIGVRGAGIPICDHAVTAVTDVTAERFTPESFVAALAGPEGPALRQSLRRSEAILAEHLVGLGRRQADARTVHFLLELHQRLRLAGLGDPSGFACPLRQGVLADALGLTNVHLSRVLRRLRESAVLTMRDSYVQFHDMDSAVAMADFDPRYLT